MVSRLREKYLENDDIFRLEKVGEWGWGGGEEILK